MRKAKKAELLNRILQLNMRSDTTFSNVYIVDGGAFLNQPNWNPQCTSNQLLEQYPQHVLYQDIATMVQKWLSLLLTQSTKSVEHSRHSEGVVIVSDTKIGNSQIKILLMKNEFLRNVNNNKSFIELFRKKFVDHGMETYERYVNTEMPMY